jgi:hypothetical protein
MLRWLDRAPEEFLIGPVVEVGEVALPKAKPTVGFDGTCKSCMGPSTTNAVSAI